jgi:ubiquinone/menaquinone biosynthesis C-methylase UbiE
MLTDRTYYEKQGEQALAEGRAFHCSEPEITRAVTRMAQRWLANAETILDLGCGANLDYDRFLADMGKRPICVDFAMNFLRLAPRDARMPLVQGDALRLPFAAATFDAVLCSETIEHIPRDECVAGEIARVPRPRGVLIVTAPSLECFTIA